MQLKISTIAIALVGLFIFCFSSPAIAANQNDISHLTETNTCFECDLSGIDLKSANLKSADLSRANLSGSELTQANLKSANLTGANLQNTKLNSADLSFTSMGGVNLSDAKLTNAILSKADLTAANLQNADLQGARFSGFAGQANLTSTNLSSANLRDVDLSNIRLLEANLSNANLSSARLDGATLNGANLSGANLTGAHLTNARLTHSNLQGTKLTGVDLSRADLTAVDFTGADLSDIKLTDAILTDALGLDPYGDSLLQKASNAATTQQFLIAMDYLKQIPVHTQAYAQAQAKMPEYEEKQRIKVQRERDEKADEALKQAYAAAGNNDYKRALSLLRRIPEDTKAYRTAQSQIPGYEHQAQEIEAEKKLKDAEWWANSEGYLIAINKLNSIPKETRVYATAQDKIAEYQEKQRQVELREAAKKNNQADSPEELLSKIDRSSFGKSYPLQAYHYALDELSKRCSTSQMHITDMSAVATKTIRDQGRSFDNLSFLKQALDATEDGLYNQSCEQIFAVLTVLIQHGV